MNKQMKTCEKKSFKNRVILLDVDEINNPLSVIDAFFQSSWLPNQLKTLKRWRNAASFENKKYRNNNPSDILYHYELIIKLLEASWLLKSQNLGKLKKEADESREITLWHIKKENKKFGDYPKSLSINEIIKPSKVLKEIYKKTNLDGYRSILKIWLYDALGKTFMEESLGKADVIKVYESLVKLFEAAWLINERSKEKAV